VLKLFQIYNLSLGCWRAGSGRKSTVGKHSTIPSYEVPPPRRIIKQELALAIPVVGLTAEFSPDVEERCLGLGMSKMLGKPVNRGDLKAALAQYIDLA